MKYFFFFLFSLIIGAGTLIFSIPYIIPIIKQRSTQPTYTSPKKLSATPIPFSIEQAPKASLRGNMTAISGSVAWQSRIATEAAIITIPQLIQQGELVETKENGLMTIQFPESVLLSILPSSILSFIQTLPANIVLEQKKGEIIYAQQGGDTPVTIRSLHLLTKFSEGEIIVIVDEKNESCIVQVKTGSVTVGYNDSENTSTVQIINQGKQFLFDDDTRIGKIKPFIE